MHSSWEGHLRDALRYLFPYLVTADLTHRVTTGLAMVWLFLVLVVHRYSSVVAHFQEHVLQFQSDPSSSIPFPNLLFPPAFVPELWPLL